MHTIEFLESKTTLYLPEDLSECNSREYITACGLIFKLQNQDITFDDFCNQLAYKLMNVKTKPQKLSEESLGNIVLIAELLESFFEPDEEGQKVLKQYYIHNPVPKINFLAHTLYGPKDSFMDMTFGEYTDALRLFLDFKATGDMHLLTLFTAIFYRRKKACITFKKIFRNFDGQVRMPYNPNLLDQHAASFKYAPIGFVYGFFLLFASFQKYLTDAKIMWGGQELDFSILFEKSGNEVQGLPSIGMDAIAFSIAESGIFGDIEKVRAANFWDVMVRMYDLRRQDLEQQKLERNAKN